LIKPISHIENDLKPKECFAILKTHNERLIA
jgi:hypothetical protein